MTSTIQDQWIDLRKKFRSLPAKSREEISVCLLKVNLGVHHDKELRKVKDFVGDVPVALVSGELEGFIEFMHSTKNDRPDVQQNMSAYKADEVETLREEVSPHSLRGSRDVKIKKN